MTIDSAAGLMCGREMKGGNERDSGTTTRRADLIGRGAMGEPESEEEEEGGDGRSWVEPLGGSCQHQLPLFIFSHSPPVVLSRDFYKGCFKSSKGEERKKNKNPEA